MLAAAAIGLLLGLRHAFEPDHLAAVSTLATRQGGLRQATRLGLAWGIGHTAVVGIVALLVIAFDVRLPAGLAPAAELLVAALLILLGGVVVWRYARGRWHIHPHSHPAAGGGAHLHLHSHAHDAHHGHPHAVDARRSLGFGLAHGLAGSGALTALLIAAAPDARARLVYFAAFGAGTIVGMFLVSAAVALIVRVATRHGPRWAALLHLGSACLSIVAGVALAQRVILP
ncbi:MAG: hypothetical protein ACREMN_07275 [Gemmatimonadales bacterium]